MRYAQQRAPAAVPEVCSAMMEPGAKLSAERSARLLQNAQRIFPAFLIFSMFALSVNGPAHAAQIGTIADVRGTVTLTRPGSGQGRVVQQGDEVLVADELRTGKGSVARLTFLDGSFVDLSPGSALRVNQYAFDAEENRRTARVRVLGGRARFVLYKALANGSAFIVETNNSLVLPAMLADFGVAEGPSGTEVVVLARSVRVKNASGLVVGEISLGVNRKTVVKEKTPPSSPVTLTREERKSYLKAVRRFRKDE
jgi:hypothetical protein